MYRKLFVNYSITIDTLYLNVKYPSTDVFKRWYRFSKAGNSRELRSGIPVGKFVVRNGVGGYKVGVWGKGIKAYLTDEVDEIRGDGRGMGIWIQIGPKFIIDHSLSRDLSRKVKEFIREIGVSKHFPIRITRIDIALDLFGSEIKNQNIQEWRKNWVGWTGASSIFFNSRTRELETVNIGS
jgi:hypothetical protein